MIGLTWISESVDSLQYCLKFNLHYLISQMQYICFRKLRKQISVKTEAEISDMRQEMENVLQPEKRGICY